MNALACFIFLCMLMLIAGWLLILFDWQRKRNEIPPGHCIACGYDLRSADHTVCPECGQEIDSN